MIKNNGYINIMHYNLETRFYSSLSEFYFPGEHVNFLR